MKKHLANLFYMNWYYACIDVPEYDVKFVTNDRPYYVIHIHKLLIIIV